MTRTYSFTMDLPQKDSTFHVITFADEGEPMVQVAFVRSADFWGGAHIRDPAALRQMAAALHAGATALEHARRAWQEEQDNDAS